MGNPLKKLEEELVNAIALANEAESSLDAASAKVKAALEEVTILQKATYKAERRYKKASEELDEKTKLADRADKAYRKAAMALESARSKYHGDINE